MDHSEVKHFPKVDHTPAELDEPSRLLLKAAAMIEKCGHCQTGCGEDEDGRLCVMIAIYAVGGREGFNQDMENATSRLEARLPAIPARLGNYRNSLDRHAARWSDATPTAEVLATMRAVALGL